MNGTSVYISTGDSYGLYQGYVISLKSVSGDGIWLELTENDVIVKSEIVTVNNYFIYNKTNKTIISIKVQKVYSGSMEQNLAALSPVYQFLDPDSPIPTQIGTDSEYNRSNDNNNTSLKKQVPRETLIWTVGIALILTLIYIIRKLW